MVLFFLTLRAKEISLGCTPKRSMLDQILKGLRIDSPFALWHYFLTCLALVLLCNKQQFIKLEDMNQQPNNLIYHKIYIFQT